MNKYRLSALLSVLLLPVVDPSLQKKDVIYEYSKAYRELSEVRGDPREKVKNTREFLSKKQNLLRKLENTCKGTPESYDELFLIFEHYYPLTEVDREIRRIQKDVKIPANINTNEYENMALIYLDKMSQVAQSLLTYRDGIVAIRTWNNQGVDPEHDIFYTDYVFDKTEIWNLLSRSISIDLMIVLFVLDSGMEEEAFYAQKPYVSLPDKLLDKVLRKGMAENHMHFHAGFDYEAHWLNKMNLWNCLEKAKHTPDDQNVSVAFFRFLATLFLQECPNTGFVNWCTGFQNGVFVPVIKTLYTGINEPVDVILFSDALCEVLNLEIIRDRTDYLIETLLESKKELRTSSEFLFLYYSMRYIQTFPHDTEFSRIFLQYIRIKNSYIRVMQQSDLMMGLKHFQKFYRSARKEGHIWAGNNGLVLDVFRSQAKINGLKKLEIRIAPDIDLKSLINLDRDMSIREIKRKLIQQLYQLFLLYRQFIFENIMGVSRTEDFLKKDGRDKRSEPYSYQSEMSHIIEKYSGQINECELPVVGIVFHFLKSEDVDNFSGYHCWRNIICGDSMITNHRFYLRDKLLLVGLALEEIRSSFPKINEYIVGIDAASDENAMEPWMFSSCYTSMRKRSVTKPVGKFAENNKWSYQRIQNIGFTYHVGEDYHHIASGLRHIDEVIERFYYKSGDRLGHALALGVDIRKWANRVEVVPISIAEYMENWIWIWGKMIVEKIDLPIQISIVEDKILSCAEKIYGSISDLPVHMLYQAYERKFYTKHREMLNHLREQEGRADGGIEKDPSRAGTKRISYCKLVDDFCPEYGGLWDVDRLLSTNYCPVFEERGRQVEMVSVTETDILLYEELQKYLLDKISRKGIYVETNPTSNLNIGDMNDLVEHPIFRMSPLNSSEKQRILVMVNSDDPIVFDTNVENEFAYIYYAMERVGCSKDESLQWIDKIRQNGMEGSFISKWKDCRTLLADIGLILDELEKNIY